MASDRHALGVANVRTKLAALGLNEFVGEALESDVGNFHFLCPDVDWLRARLVEMGWELEGGEGDHWHAREPVARWSLHIKHFDGWPDDQLQAHVDPWGITGPITWLLHALNARGYRRVETIARALDR